MGIFNRKKSEKKIVLPPPDQIVRQFLAEARWGRDTVCRSGRQLTPTGKWICTRCNRQFKRKDAAQKEWWTLKEGPHVCPDCRSYAFTVPVP